MNNEEVVKHIRKVIDKKISDIEKIMNVQIIYRDLIATKPSFSFKKFSEDSQKYYTYKLFQSNKKIKIEGFSGIAFNFTDIDERKQKTISAIFTQILSLNHSAFIISKLDR